MVYGEALGMSTLCIKENPKDDFVWVRWVSGSSRSCIGRRPGEGGLLQCEAGHGKFRATLEAELSSMMTLFGMDLRKFTSVHAASDL